MRPAGRVGEGSPGAVPRRRGERPLNLRVGPGQAVRIVLLDPAGARRAGRPDRGHAGLVRTTAAPGADDLGSAAPVPIGWASAGAAAVGWHRTGSMADAFGQIAPRSFAIRRAGAGRPGLSFQRPPDRLRHRPGREGQPAVSQVIEDQPPAVDVAAAVDPARRAREHLRAAAGRGGVADPAPPP